MRKSFLKGKTTPQQNNVGGGNLEITFSSPEGLLHQSLINVINIWTQACVIKDNELDSDCFDRILTILIC